MSGFEPMPQVARDVRGELPALVRIAALTGVEQTIARFLGKGGNANATDERGRTLLHLAAGGGHLGLCRLLVEAGADPAIRDGAGDSPLDIASGNGEIAECLRIAAKMREAQIHDDHQGAEQGTASQTRDATSLQIEEQEHVPLAEIDGWVPEGPTFQPEGDQSRKAESLGVHGRINAHQPRDHASSWEEVEALLPQIRRGIAEYAGLDEAFLRRVAGMIRYGEQHGSVPENWPEDIALDFGPEGASADMSARLGMLLGELGIHLDEPDASGGHRDLEADPSALTEEVLDFLSDLATSPDPLAYYYQLIGPLPLLSKEEEVDLGRRWREGGDLSALNGLVTGNLRFVIQEAKKFRGMNADPMDMVSIGNLGLVNAARRFDPDMENRFLTYAAWWVKQSLLAEIGDLTREISVPQKVSWMLLHLDRRASRAELELGRPATDEELAIAFETDSKRIDQLKRLQILTSRNYLEEVLGGVEANDGEPPVVLEVEGHEGEYIIERESMLWEIEASLAWMTERERAIVCQHFGLMGFDPETLEEIGRKCDPPISRERVRQLEERAFERVRRRRAESLGSLLRGPSPFETDRREMTRGMSAFKQWEMDDHE